MGITGLLPSVKSQITNSHVKDFKGRRVAVDGYAWLHKAAYSCARELCRGEHTDKWVYYILGQIDMFTFHDVHVTMVFDGANLPAKEVTEVSRAESRKKNLEKAEFLCQQNKSSEAYQFFSAAVDISPRMAAELIRILREKRPEVGICVAPYEADAQLALLVRGGHVDVIVGEDSDTIPFGCKEMIYKLAKDGSCTRLVLEDLYTKPTAGFDMRKFTPEMTLAMCVAAGCDYLPSPPKFGLKKAYEMIKKQKSIVKMLRGMRLAGAIPLRFVKNLETGRNSSVLQYEVDFHKAISTFRHQIVFDPTLRAVRHLAPLLYADQPPCLQSLMDKASTEDPSPAALASAFSWVGALLSDSLACGIADGLVDPCTGEPFNLPPRLEAPLRDRTSRARRGDDKEKGLKKGGIQGFFNSNSDSNSNSNRTSASSSSSSSSRFSHSSYSSSPVKRMSVASRANEFFSDEGGVDQYPGVTGTTCTTDASSANPSGGYLGASGGGISGFSSFSAGGPGSSSPLSLGQFKANANSMSNIRDANDTRGATAAITATVSGAQVHSRGSHGSSIKGTKGAVADRSGSTGVTAPTFKAFIPPSNSSNSLSSLKTSKASSSFFGGSRGSSGLRGGIGGGGQGINKRHLSQPADTRSISQSLDSLREQTQKRARQALQQHPHSPPSSATSASTSASVSASANVRARAPNPMLEKSPSPSPTTRARARAMQDQQRAVAAVLGNKATLPLPAPSSASSETSSISAYGYDLSLSPPTRERERNGGLDLVLESEEIHTQTNTHTYANANAHMVDTVGIAELDRFKCAEFSFKQDRQEREQGQIQIHANTQPFFDADADDEKRKNKDVPICIDDDTHDTNPQTGSFFDQFKFKG